MNKDEFWTVFAPINGLLFGFAMRFLREPEDAKDACQNVLEKLWVNRMNLRKEENVKSLAMKIMKNECIDRLRKKEIRGGQRSELHTAKIEMNYENKHFVEILKEGMESLPEQQKLAIELKEFQGYSYTEISKVLGISINTARVNVSRGRQKLIKSLNHEWKE